MLGADDNELLTRVGRGTPMGELMRQYWVPVGASHELVAGGSPVRMMVLGEKLLGYRTKSGAVSLIPHGCPHRGASLFLGRNEDGGAGGEGIRCVYHGWKFDVSGRCVDMPSEPADSTFKDRVAVRAYPCVEAGGLIWGYLGDRDTPPPMPGFEWFDEADTEVWGFGFERECNWLQALEGDIDTAHLGFLHFGGAQPEDVEEGTFLRYLVEDPTPRFKVLDTEVGVTYGAYRPAGSPDSQYWRFGHFLFPFYTMIPTGVLGAKREMRAWVPMDDTHTLLLHSIPLNSGAYIAPASQKVGVTERELAGFQLRPSTNGWFGRMRLLQGADNDYQQDRELQRNGQSYTGIPTFTAEDTAVTETMGEIVDRSNEHLATSDMMIIRVRRRLLKAVKALRDAATTPPAVDEPNAYVLRAGGIVLPADQDWLDSTADLREGRIDFRTIDATTSGGA